jgi:hypothetical protein
VTVVRTNFYTKLCTDGSFDSARRCALRLCLSSPCLADAVQVDLPQAPWPSSF